MKHDCEIVRDLMPLVVDGTASEKSRAMVEEHAAECEPCLEMYEEMRQEVPPEPLAERGGQVVKKLRQRRRLRRALLVLLGMAISALLVFAGWRGWNYGFNTYVVLTAETDYNLEIVQDGAGGVESVWTILDGRAQEYNGYFDVETGDMYFWSTTTRLPLPAFSDKIINSEAQLFYFDDIGYGYIVGYYDLKAKRETFDIVPVNRVIKGAPETLFTHGDSSVWKVIYERPNPPDEALIEAWREKMREMGDFRTWRDRLGHPRVVVIEWENDE